MGLTVSDAVRMLLTRVANEGELPPGLAVDPAVHDAWFRDKVREALADTRSVVPHAEVEARFAKRCAACACCMVPWSRYRKGDTETVQRRHTHQFSADAPS